MTKKQILIIFLLLFVSVLLAITVIDNDFKLLFGIFVISILLFLRIEYLIYVLLISCSIVLPVLQLPFHDLSYLRLDDVVWAVIFIRTFKKINVNCKSILREYPYIQPLLIMSFIVIILDIRVLQLDFIENTGIGLPLWLQFRYFQAVYVFVVILYYFQDTDTKTYVTLNIFLGTCLAIVGILQSMDILPMYVYHKTYKIHKASDITSLLSYLNFHLANFLAITCLLAFDRIVFDGKYLRKIVWLLLFLVMFYCLILTNSRGGFVGCLMSLVYYIFFVNRIRFKIGALTVMMVLIGIATIYFGLQDVLLYWTHNPDRVGTMYSRLEGWDAVYEYISYNPSILIFGVGMGNWMKALSPHVQTASAHNIFINVLCELGIVGLFFFLYFWGKILKASPKEMKAGNVSAIVLASLIVGLFMSGFTGESNYPMLATENNFLMVMVTSAILLSNFKKKGQLRRRNK